MKGEWVPAMVEEARKYGLRVTGHVPAFSTANQMTVAGYDELTHINQVVLGWVLEKDEYVRTLLRVTAMKRLQDLDMDDPRINETITAMLENNVAIDPTLAIFELFFNGRNGVPNPAIIALLAAALLATTSTLVLAKDSSYTYGTVWEAHGIKVKSGQFENYMDHLAAGWKQSYEMGKEEGYVVDY
jgi:hypothetical protein